MNNGFRSIAILTSLLLAGCGGGGGGGGGSSIPDQALGGIWTGTGNSSLDPGTVVTVIALSTDDGEFRTLSDLGVQSVGQFTTNGNRISGNSIDYAPEGEVFGNGLPVTTGSYTGTIVERQSIEGQWTSTGESGNFVMDYDDLHAIPSSLVTVSGTYATTDEFGDPDGTVTISGAGAISGSDSSGCVYGGNVQIIDSRYNVYRLNVTASNCGEADGSYTGLGAYDPSDSSLAFQVDNADFILTDEITKI